MRTLTIAALLMAIAPADAATLKPITTLHAPVVRLEDLFRDAGPEADRVLGPGPGPGGRIVVESTQLAYIARRFGVDWHPTGPGDRAILDRPGRPLALAEVMAPLRSALIAAGATADCDIDLGPFTPPLVPPEAGFSAVIAGLQYDTQSGRFTALLTLTGTTIDEITVNLAGRAEATLQVPVAVGRLAAGTVITAADLRMARLRVSDVTRDVARQVQDAIGLQLRDQVADGQPLPRTDLERPLLVTKGARVVMLLDSPGIALTAEGQALDAGAEGDQIRVQNPVSHAVVEAEVLADGRVRVAPGAVPLVPAARQRTAELIER
jgi:flagellar basal body P-ring formation protein FlgA